MPSSMPPARRVVSSGMAALDYLTSEERPVSGNSAILRVVHRDLPEMSGLAVLRHRESLRDSYSKRLRYTS